MEPKHDSTSSDMSLLERVNPIFHTAGMTLYGLAASGDEDAAMIIELLNQSSDARPSVTPISNTEDSLTGIQNLANAVFLEIRYRTVQAMAVQSDCAAIVDLPCGYTPRGIQMARIRRNYIGLDLPATIHDLDPVIKPLIQNENRSYVRYAALTAPDD